MIGREPSPPLRDAFAGGCRHADRANRGIDAAGIFLALVEVELDVGREVDLVDDHQIGRGKHVGIFKRLVVAFGDGNDHHLVRFAEIKLGRAHEVADVFDENKA